MCALQKVELGLSIDLLGGKLGKGLAPHIKLLTVHGSDDEDEHRPETGRKQPARYSAY